MPDNRAKRGRTGASESSRDTNLPSRDSSSSGFGYTPFIYQQHRSDTTVDAAAAQQSTPRGPSPGQGRSVPDNPREQVPANTLTPPSGKVQIPAIKRETEFTKKPDRKIRTSHACDNCRRAKAGCTGGQPCLRCRNTRAQCVYGDGKRDKERKRISKLSKDAQVFQHYTSDLKDAVQRIRDDDTMSPIQLKAALGRIMAMTPSPLSPDDGEMSVSAAAHNTMASERDEGGDSDDQMEVGSTESLDLIDNDADRDDTRQTGHLGKSSSVAWAKRSAMEVSGIKGQDSVLGTQSGGHTMSSYHTEEADLDYVDTTRIDPFEWPEDGVSRKLLDIYWAHVHDIYPVLDKSSFQSSYKEFPRTSRYLSIDQRIWLATLNSIWAISCVFARLASGDFQPHHDDHFLYIAKAKSLSKELDLVYGDPRISMVQFLAVIGLYYLTTNRLNRSWSLCGLAVRHATSLGLHVRQEMKSVSEADKEYRVRVWWSLYLLECSLDKLTGRPSCISDGDVSAPLPINVNEDDFRRGQPLHTQAEHAFPATEQGSRVASFDRTASSSKPVPSKRAYLSVTDMISSEENSPLPTDLTGQTRNPQTLAYTFPVSRPPPTVSSYFVYSTQLAIIAHQIVTHLYSAATISEPWPAVRRTITKIDYRLLAWREVLPKTFDISFNTSSEPDWNDPYLLQRTGLAMAFNSSRMVLFRPCLCRVEDRIDHQSSKSKDFTHDAVLTCIRSARNMISLIYWSSGSPRKLYDLPPWWMTLHYVCEALSVLMLEMSFKAQHIPEEADLILEDAKKGIKWLIMLSARSVSARKAWEIFDTLIRVVAPLVNGNTEDMPTEAAIPTGYNWRRFNNSVINARPGQSGGHDLTSANLERYEDSQSPVSGKQATTAWASVDQRAIIEAGGNVPMEGCTKFQNPLDPATALQSLQGITTPHGGYDQPWQQFFIHDNMQMAGTAATSAMEYLNPTLTATERPPQSPYMPETGYPDLGASPEQKHAGGGWFAGSDSQY